MSGWNDLFAHLRRRYGDAPGGSALWQALAGRGSVRAFRDPAPSLRLPLSLTLHDNFYGEGDIRAAIDAYDRRRAVRQPYAQQRRADELGPAERYGWSEDKARQYNLPERADFGAFIRSKGFRLG